MKELVNELNNLWNFHIEKFIGKSNMQSQCFFDEIVVFYTQKDRKYHNLNHLKDLFVILYEINLTDESVIWSVWYHDIIYNISSYNNEIDSAILAKDRLQKIGVKEEVFCKVYDYIIATKTHKSDDEICKLFLDADMAIIGSEIPKYLEYAKKIKQEYSSMDEDSFKTGRINFLESVLHQDKLFLTDFFNEKYMRQAKINIKTEIDIYK